MCTVSITTERQSVVDFSELVFVGEVTFASQMPSQRQTKDLILATPLEPTVWTLILATFLTFSLIIYFITKIFPLRAGFSSNYSSYSSILLSLFAIYTHVSLPHLWKTRRISVGILAAFWILGSFILTIGYCARLYAILTFPGSVHPIETIDQLIQVAEDDSYLIFLRKYSSLWNVIVNSKERGSLFYIIAQHLDRNSRHSKEFENIDRYWGKVEESSRFIVLGNQLNLELFRRTKARRAIHISSETILRDYNAFMFPQKSPLLRPFNVVYVCTAINKLRFLIYTFYLFFLV